MTLRLAVGGVRRVLGPGEEEENSLDQLVASAVEVMADKAIENMAVTEGVWTYIHTASATPSSLLNVLLRFNSSCCAAAVMVARPIAIAEPRVGAVFGPVRALIYLSARSSLIAELLRVDG